MIDKGAMEKDAKYRAQCQQLLPTENHSQIESMDTRNV